MEHPPGVGRRRNLRAALERGDQHVDRRHQREDREDREEEIRPPQRPNPVTAPAAAIPRIGNMNSETLAPSGISPPSMPRRNAQVAKIWVRSSGPPAVRMRVMS